jgi:hypothetical protein
MYAFKAVLAFALALYLQGCGEGATQTVENLQQKVEKVEEFNAEVEAEKIVEKAEETVSKMVEKIPTVANEVIEEAADAVSALTEKAVSDAEKAVTDAVSQMTTGATTTEAESSEEGEVAVKSSKPTKKIVIAAVAAGSVLAVVFLVQAITKDHCMYNRNVFGKIGNCASNVAHRFIGIPKAFLGLFKKSPVIAENKPVENKKIVEHKTVVEPKKTEEKKTEEKKTEEKKGVSMVQVQTVSDNLSENMKKIQMALLRKVGQAQTEMKDETNEVKNKVFEEAKDLMKEYNEVKRDGINSMDEQIRNMKDAINAGFNGVVNDVVHLVA